MTDDLFSPYANESIRDRKLSTRYQSSELSINIQHTTHQQDYLTEPVNATKLRWVWLIGMIVLAGLLGRLIYLQIWQGASYLATAEANRIQLQYLPAQRGLIYDHTGKALVTNVPNFSVTLTPSELPKTTALRRTIIIQTAAAVTTTPDDLITQVETALATDRLISQPIIVKEFIPYQSALPLFSSIDALPGVAVTVEAARSYTNPVTMAHLLGYLGKLNEADLSDTQYEGYSLTDRVGKTGLEANYEHWLHGIKGQARIEVNALGTEQNEIARQEPIAGANLTLSIDSGLQQRLYEALASYTDQYQLPGGAAVAIDPRTGAVRALVSYPSFDATQLTQGMSQTDYQFLANDERKPLFNKAISGEYPSGSTFKLVMAAAALNEGVITPQTTIVSTGGIFIGETKFEDYLTQGHGVTDVRKAIADSVNSFFYLAGGGSYDAETRTINGGLGINRIKDYAYLFGLGAASGIDLPNEGSGFVPSPEWKATQNDDGWHIGDTYHVSIGQGDLLVTPLQVAQYTSVVANGGTLYQPSILEQVTSADGSVAFTQTPTIIRSNFVSSDVLGVVREGMRQGVVSGSSRSLNNLPFAVAGKTGTAQIGGTDNTHSWFTAFAPYDNPELVITVLVEDGGEGGAAALPIAREGLKQYFAGAAGAN